MKKFSSTMKGSSRRSSRTKTVWKIAALTLAGVALFYLVPRLLFLVVSIVFYPINAAQSWFYESSASLPQYLRDRSELVEEMQLLEQKVLEQGGAEHTVSLLKRENEELRALLADDESDRILAGVIARPNQLPYDVILLDQGTDDGVVEGAPVYIGNNTVIGYIHRTTARSSQVTLVTSPGFRSTVFVFGPDIYTTAVGQGGGLVRIGVPQGIDLNEGDLVVLPSVTSGVYGEVEYIESASTQPEQYGFVAPSIPLHSLRLVSIGRTAIVGNDFTSVEANVDSAYAKYFTAPVPEGQLITLGGTSTATTTNQINATSSATTSVQ